MSNLTEFCKETQELFDKMWRSTDHQVIFHLEAQNDDLAYLYLVFDPDGDCETNISYPTKFELEEGYGDAFHRYSIDIKDWKNTFYDDYKNIVNHYNSTFIKYKKCHLLTAPSFQKLCANVDISNARSRILLLL